MRARQGIVRAWRGRLNRAALLGAVTASLAACAAPPSGRSADLMDILNYARAHPEERLAMEVACQDSLVRRAGDFPYEALFAGLFDVPRGSGGVTFCAALIESVVSGDLSQSEQDVFSRPRAVRGLAPVGSLFRTLLIAHERLAAQQAQRPPQAQSCGCGQ